MVSTNHYFDVILVTNDSRSSTKRHGAIAWIGRADLILSYIGGAAVRDPVPCKSPARTSPEIVRAKILELGPRVDFPIERARQIKFGIEDGIGAWFAKGGVADRREKISGESIGELAVDCKGSFVEDGGEKQRFGHGREGGGGVEGRCDEGTVVNGTNGFSWASRRFDSGGCLEKRVLCGKDAIHGQGISAGHVRGGAIDHAIERILKRCLGIG